MTELTENERTLLIDLLEAARKEKLHELHHADTFAYKELLRRHLDTIERLVDRFTGAMSGGHETKR